MLVHGLVNARAWAGEILVHELVRAGQGWCMGWWLLVAAGEGWSGLAKGLATSWLRACCAPFTCCAPRPCLAIASATPLFFILFPGYSPSKEIEAFARKGGRSVEAGSLTIISMGQGQEGPAEAVLDRCTRTHAGRRQPSERSHGLSLAAWRCVNGSRNARAPATRAWQVHPRGRLGVPGQRAPDAGLDPAPGGQAGGGRRVGAHRLPLLLQRRAHQRRAAGARRAWTAAGPAASLACPCRCTLASHT